MAKGKDSRMPKEILDLRSKYEVKVTYTDGSSPDKKFVQESADTLGLVKRYDDPFSKRSICIDRECMPNDKSILIDYVATVIDLLDGRSGSVRIGNDYEREGFRGIWRDSDEGTPFSFVLYTYPEVMFTVMDYPWAGKRKSFGTKLMNLFG